jgi:hypothetical protein
VAVRGYRSGSAEFQRSKRRINENIIMTVLVIVTAMSPIALLAQTQTYRAEV